jgi:hypothetical protein
MGSFKKFDDYFTYKIYGKKSNHVLFLFGGWRFSPILYKPLINSLIKNDIQCILYMPHADLIAVGTQYSEIVNATKLIVQHIKGEIKLNQNIAYSIFGISFGTLFAMECAKRIGSIKNIILISPFGDFTEHVKLWPSHIYFGRVLVSQKTTSAESAIVLNEVGTVKNLNLLRDKRILLYYAANDSIIHTSATENLIEALMSAQINTTAIKVRGGHFTGAIKHLLFTKEYLPFLLSD